MGGREEEGRSLAETPTWAVATVITFMVTIGFLIHGGLVKFGKWLDRTKRKQLLAALDKIKEELMVFGLLSLLMGHWIVFVAKICVKSSAVSSRFYPCVASNYVKHEGFENQAVDLRSNHLNSSTARLLLEDVHQRFCPQEHQPFASYESLEQLHRLLFVLGITHVSYSFLAVALALIKIYSWRTWENHAKTMALRGLLTTDTSADPEDRGTGGVRMKRLTTFISHHTSHPWSQHRLLVWLVCPPVEFHSRQFWSSINQADYTALRLGFLTTHQLPFTYDFHNYMLRSMEEEFRDIVGISIPLWIFAITCIVLGFHGTNIYFWVSFLPAINAFEMATYIWSMWEIKDSSCFIGDRTFLITRLTFGIVSQFWCSFITFPLYVIVAQMGSKFKKTIVSENVRKSLHGWRRKVKTRHGRQPFRMLTMPSPVVNEGDENLESVSSTKGGRSTRFEGRFTPNQNLSLGQSEPNEVSSFNEKLQDQVCSAPQDEYSDERYDQEIKPSDDIDDHPVLPSKEQLN
ncbi:MLO-like protein 4 [Sesamum angolense]|uniref:MLO-like protein n=1 Tax=Sesamum angolense TaxID=2727404 RepID=A0AAE2BYE0_9LAMI|nr:MLO-like protein 4 [Sesamum angolense]